MRKLLFFVLAALLFMVAGCSPQPLPLTPTATLAPPTHTPTATTTFTPLPTSTHTATITPTPTWVFQPAGEVTCPILLYHRIAEPPSDDPLVARYYIPPAEFEMQMQTLRDWGYTAIPISLLIAAIKDGAPLPPRPVVITFDDGDASVHDNAFPIMERLGYTGVIYLVVNYMEQDGYMGVAEVQRLAAAGWEVGSHSYSHIDMVANIERMRIEGYESRLELQKMLDLPIGTYAYPFGVASPFVIDHVDGYGYQGAVGLGTFYTHPPYTLFYLSRIEVRNGTQPDTLAGMLPWSGALSAALSAVFTPTP